MASIMTAAVGATNLTALFGQSLSSGADIFFPTDSTWVNETQQRWSDYQAPTYLGAIKPATEEDVQTIVRLHMLSFWSIPIDGTEEYVLADIPM